jgi:hypothetical protein
LFAKKSLLCALDGKISQKGTISLNRLKVTPHSISGYLIRLSVSIAIVLLLFPASASAAGSTYYASDITPPKITIIAPLRDSQTDTGTPRIEVSFVDLISGIRTDTINLFIDRIEVTAGAVIEQEDPTGQDAASPWRITYTPKVALSKGNHTIRFSVQDLAGNLAELAWNFEVTVGGRGGGLSISGGNTLRVDVSPVKKTEDTLDLTVQGQYRNTAIRWNGTGQITDYPGSEPDYSYGRYNFYYDDYALGFYRGQASAVFGYVNASLDSELLQIGLKMYGNGGVVSDTLKGAGGQYHWTVFNGDSGSSYGTGSSSYRMTGAGGKWRSGSGLTMGGYYVSLDGKRAYDFVGFRGNAVNNLGLFRFEVIHGTLETNQTSGAGWALHWDKSLLGCDWGLDYTESEADYPEYGSSALFTSTDGGLRSYAIRVSTAINQFHSLSFDGYFARDNLDHSQTATETHQNISATYGYRPKSGFSLNANYQGDFENEAGISTEDHVFILGIQQKMGVSQLKLTCTLNTARDPDPDDTYDRIQLLSSWMSPVGAYNLTPSLQWSDQKDGDGDWSKAIEVRLTLDRRFYSDLARSSMALFYRVSDVLDGDEQTKKTEFGILPSLYLKTGPHSTLTLVYDYSDWFKEITNEDGVNKTINLTWKVTFLN